MELTKKFLLGTITGAFILTIIFNSIYDILVQPLLKMSSNLILKCLTLGIKSIEDGIYLEIAKGFHEGIAIMNNIVIFFVFVAIIFLIIIVLFSLVTGNLNPFYRVLEKKKIPTEDIILFIIFLSMFLMLFSNSIRMTYINDKVTYFEQMCDITSPFVEEKDMLMFKSQFAQIQNKEGYDNLIKSLEAIADKNNLYYKEYNFFGW